MNIKAILIICLALLSKSVFASVDCEKQELTDIYQSADVVVMATAVDSVMDGNDYYQWYLRSINKKESDPLSATEKEEYSTSWKQYFSTNLFSTFTPIFFYKGGHNDNQPFKVADTVTRQSYFSPGNTYILFLSKADEGRFEQNGCYYLDLGGLNGSISQGFSSGDTVKSITNHLMRLRNQ